MSKKQTVVFDFDGVIHSYTSGWKGEDVIPDPPVHGIKEVVVVSARCAKSNGMVDIIKWLDMYGIKVDKVLAEKPPAVVYIDDRAICFDGRPDKLLGQIQDIVPWYNKI